MSSEAAGIILYQQPFNALVEWGPTEFAGVAIAGSVAAPARTIRTTAAELDAMALAGTLTVRTILEVTDAGFLAVPSSGSTYRRYYPIHIGPDAPDDISVIWLQTS